MTKNMERKIILFVLGFVGLFISIAAGLQEHLPALQAVCTSACKETAQMTLVALPFWAWGVAFYAAVILLTLFKTDWVSLIAAAAFGMELALVWIMFLMKAACVFCIANSVVVLLLVIFSFSKRRSWQESTVALLVLILSVIFIPFENQLFALSPTQGGPEIAARVGDETITTQRLEVSLGSKLFDLQKDVYRMKKERLDQLVTDTIMQKEAKAAGKNLDQYIDDALPLQLFSVSDQDVNKYIEENMDRLKEWTGSAAELRNRIKTFLQQQKRVQGINQYARALEKKYNVQTFLAMPHTPVVRVNTEGSPAAGPADSQVTVVEFSDYECPACRANHLDVIKKIKALYGDKVRWVFRDYPLKRHKDAFKAAEAAHCVDEQGRFWEYQDVLFSAENLDETSLVNAAAKLGVSPEKMRQCMKEEKYKDFIEKGMQEATRAGIDRTPSFIINGTVYVGGPSFETFRSVLDEELNKKDKKISMSGK